jgi:hypothetical protein
MAARISITKLIQRSYRIVKGLKPSDAPPRITIHRHEKLTVNWN